MEYVGLCVLHTGLPPLPTHNGKVNATKVVARHSRSLAKVVMFWVRAIAVHLLRRWGAVRVKRQPSGD